MQRFKTTTVNIETGEETESFSNFIYGLDKNSILSDGVETATFMVTLDDSVPDVEVSIILDEEIIDAKKTVNKSVSFSIALSSKGEFTFYSQIGETKVSFIVEGV
jgi:hypothetical protein